MCVRACVVGGGYDRIRFVFPKDWYRKNWKGERVDEGSPIIRLLG